MLNINTSIQTHPSNKGPARNGNPTHICIHYIGVAKQDAKNASENYQNNILGFSPHYFVDDNEIYQVNDDLNASGHCEGGSPQPGCTGNNANSIGIEMCTCGGYDVSTRTEQNTIELTKYLMNKYNIPVSNVIRHFDTASKQCPAPFMSPEEVKKSHQDLDRDGSHFPNGGDRWRKFKAALGGGATANGYGWEDVTKALMKVGYERHKEYSAATDDIEILGKTVKVRWDCAGLVTSVLQYFDILDGLGSTASIAADGIPGFNKVEYTSLDDCRPGDILFRHGMAGQTDHTEIYAGNKKSYNWGVHPYLSTPENNYQQNSSNQWQYVWRGLASQAGGSGGSGGGSANPFDWNLSDGQANLIIEQNNQVIQELKKQGLDAVIEESYMKIDYTARLNDYVKYLNVHKIAGIQMPPTTMLRKNFKQDFIVIVRKKLYYAATMSSDEEYLRLYYFNNLIGCSVSHQVNGTGTCSFEIMGGQRVTVINNMQETEQGWVDYEHILEGLTNIDNEASNKTNDNYMSYDENAEVEHKWRMGSDDWNDTTASGVDYRDLMKAKQAKYGWRYAEKCDIEPMDEVIVFVKSRYNKNEHGHYKFNKMFVGYIDQVTKKYSAGASAPNIQVACTDQTKLLGQSYVNHHPAYMPGKGNKGYLDISFDTDKFGFFKINEPIAYGMENFKDSTVRETLQNDFLAQNIFYGLNPDSIIKTNCLAAGIPPKYLSKRLEPVKVIPYLYNMTGGSYDFLNAQFKRRSDYITEIAKICFMEFFFDEEGQAVFKIPSYVIGTNTIKENNDDNDITPEMRAQIGLKQEYAVNIGVLSPYCNLVTPMIYTVQKGQTLKQISQDVYGHIDRATEIQILNLSRFQKYSTHTPLPQCDILVLKFDDTDIAARKEYRELISFDLTSSLAQTLYTKQVEAQNGKQEQGVVDQLYQTTNEITMSQITDDRIKVIPQEDIISFTLTDSDKDICTCVSVTAASFLDYFSGNNAANFNRTVPSLSMIMRYGVRPGSVDNTPFVTSEKDAEIMADMKLLQQLAMRYTASATVVENSDIKVGTPIRFFSYDEHPNADTMAFAESADIAKTVFYITRINRSYKQDGVSTMTLDLVAGRTMGQQSVFDIMWTLYRTFYTARKDVDIETAQSLVSQYSSSIFGSGSGDGSGSANEDLGTMDTNIGELVNTSFKDINASNPGETSGWNKDRLAAIYNYFRNTVGFNKAACCGIIGSLAQETGGQFNYNDTGEDAGNALNDYGIVQWQGGRADNLKKFAQEKGKEWNNLDVQLAFMVHELNNSYKGVLSTLQSVANTAVGAYNAGLSFASDYEVCSANYNGQNFRVQRAKIAQRLFEQCFKNIS